MTAPCYASKAALKPCSLVESPISSQSSFGLANSSRSAEDKDSASFEKGNQRAYESATVQEAAQVQISLLCGPFLTSALEDFSVSAVVL
jgi:hypothetical protein